MRVPVSWLKDFVNISEAPEQLAQKLQRVGVPVERVEYMSPGITRVVSGKITEMAAHPNADKLRVAQVDVGKETLQIVTGAPNVKQGDIIPVALVGAELAGGKKIQEAKLRGLPSHGMMCSADELALGIKEFLPAAQQVGVMVLDPETPIGVDLSAMLGLNEAVLVLEPFANRSDYLSVFGVAREVAAIYGEKLKFPELHPESDKPLSDVTVEIQDFQSCSRYIARRASGVNVKPSPLWMAVRLHAAGVRPINNVVDITNYVLLELGQPLHAFDCALLPGKNIVVRKGREGETLKAIDEKVYDVAESMLVIAAGDKPVALAGVMGGKGSEIGESTTDVLLEAAHFDAGIIRRASVKLALRTESSRRFEKGLDPVGADWGSRRACHLLTKAGATVADGVADAHKKLAPPREIGVSLARIKSLIGVEDLERQAVEKILSGLGFVIVNTEAILKNRLGADESYDLGLQETLTMLVQSPPLRCDIHEEIDVVEEVARHYGYDRVPSILPSGTTTPAKLDRPEAFERKLRTLLGGLGLTEVITYSLGDPAALEKLRLGSLATILNPLTEDRKALRPLLYPGLLWTLKKNFAVKNKDLALYEIGKVFKKGDDISERRHLCVALAGKLSWGADASFFSLKGVLESLWEGLHITEPFKLKGEARAAFHPQRFAAIQHQGKVIGMLGELHPLTLEAFEIGESAFILEISVEKLQTLEKPVPRYKPLPLYPESRRDVSMILDERIPVGEVLDLVRTEGSALVEEAKIFDIYQGTQVPRNKKSIAFSVTYRSPEKTLTDEEVNALHQKIKDALATRFGVTIRE